MKRSQIKNEYAEEDPCLEENVENGEEMPIISVVVNPDSPQNINALSSNVPLFIKKLWIIVNDESNKEIISWNSSGDGFEMHDQLGFISQTLPKYFKHNQLSSFVRQLNLYGFHKSQSIERDEFQFTHPFFLKDVPQLLPLIKRKVPSGRSQSTKPTPNENSPHAPIVQELVGTIKNITDKSDAIATDMSKLRQENAALWREMNTLRLKYSKQTKIINKLIHFLIAYMQKHHNSRKGGRTVSPANSNKFLKTGPKIMELDYRYKNNPHEFWTDFDNEQSAPDHENYTVVEPADSPSSQCGQASEIAKSHNMRVSSTIDELLPNSNTYDPMAGASNSPLPQFDYKSSLPSSSKASNSALQRAGGSKDNLGYLIDNSRVEMSTIKELIKNLTPDDMTTFYKLVNENCKAQEEDLNFDVASDLMSSLAVPEVDNNISQSDLENLEKMIQNQIGNTEALSQPLSSNDTIQADTINSALADPSSSVQKSDDPGLPSIDDGALGLIGLDDDLFNTDDILTNVSVDQFFNMN
ncbi:heat shock factor protein isoform X2 [Dendroctonus ponderosae]|uniref:HSF-type DNA-binding domain-containing protein n=1 Tax=Dendroctonus ponderosae TaxID=77166 RepID=A0AAR5P7Z6_DENPD|nr:heat shock factor protein isoform X2 [Dendroctonus ponderosae]